MKGKEQHTESVLPTPIPHVEGIGFVRQFTKRIIASNLMKLPDLKRNVILLPTLKSWEVSLKKTKVAKN